MLHILGLTPAVAMCPSSRTIVHRKGRAAAESPPARACCTTSNLLESRSPGRVARLLEPSAPCALAFWRGELVGMEISATVPVLNAAEYFPPVSRR